MTVTENDLKHLEQKLCRQRWEILLSYQGLEEDWIQLGDREIEYEEEAQKASLTELFEQLDEREKKEIEEINLALDRIETGTYGTCEICLKSIPLARLESLPAVRLCVSCAEKEEAKAKKKAAPPARA